ncbi:MAG: hypothetical protein ACJAQZ_004262 [Planctomycetota bacterium]|jgi:hypothetical protein
MIRPSQVIRVVGVLSLTLLPSCAWSNIANRPVWNAFESNLVPDSGGLFAATLPVTVPLGLVSIVVDTVIAHPLQVVDEAYGDAARIWDPEDLEFDEAYYTEMGFLPIRTLVTPIVFAGSFLGRSLFDIRAPVAPMSEAEHIAEVERQHEARVQQQRKSFIAWLHASGTTGGAVDVVGWHASFEQPMREALAGDGAHRARLHTGMLRAGFTKIGNYDGEAGLRDADPVVRYMSVFYWPRRAAKPSKELLGALRQDPVETVRLMAEHRFGR